MKHLQLVLTLDVPEATPSNNTIKGLHFRAWTAMRERWRSQVIAAMPPAFVGAQLDRCFITVERHCSGQLDWDNAYGGLKPLLDCLVAPTKRNPSGLGVIADDSPTHMPLPPLIRQVKAKRGASRTIVRIYDASALIVTENNEFWEQQ